MTTQIEITSAEINEPKTKAAKTAKGASAPKVPKAPAALPSSLAFARCVEPTQAIMEAVAAGEGFQGIASLFDARSAGTYLKSPVRISTTTVRGTISHFDKAAPADRMNTGSKAINAANIATIEQALMPADADLLFSQFSVRFAGHALHPTMSNHPEFTANLVNFVEKYGKAGGFEELALRYLLNLANGSWLWRNQFGDDLQVRIAQGDLVLILSEGDVDMSAGFSLLAITNEVTRELFAGLVGRIAAVLGGETGQFSSICLECSALVRMGAGAEVYPSQEMASESTQTMGVKEKCAKVLSKNRLMDGTDVATIHARKLNNAIRSIDTWHGEEGIGAIAVDVFGADTFRAMAHRIKGNDLYSYLKDPIALVQTLDNGLNGIHHFVVACLIRGGVFGFGKSE